MLAKRRKSLRHITSLVLCRMVIYMLLLYMNQDLAHPVFGIPHQLTADVFLYLEHACFLRDQELDHFALNASKIDSKPNGAG